MMRRGLGILGGAALVAGGIFFGAGATGRIGVPVEPVTCTSTITAGTSKATIEATIVAAAPGSTVCFNEASFPFFQLLGVEKASAVTLRSSEGQTASLAGVRLAGSNHLSFTHLHFTEGVDIEDNASHPGSHDISVTYDTFTEPLYAVRMLQQAGSVIKNVTIEHDFGNKARLENEGTCSPGIGGTYVEIYGAEGVTIKHNTFQQAEWHYIQGGAAGPAGVLVESNLFTAEYTERCSAHLNAWQIYQGSAGPDTFRNNVVWGPTITNPAGVIALIFENGSAGAECGVTMTETTIENNLFYDPSSSNIAQIGQTGGFLTIKNNTGVRFNWGWRALGECGASTNVTQTHNVMVEGHGGGEAQNGFNGFSCAGTCVFDYNVSSDGTSACAYGGTTHCKTSWGPEWLSTGPWNPLEKIASGFLFPDPPTGYYVAKGLAFESGYQGGGGP